jgi:aldehyde dehydrogenase (NAD+)
MGPLASAAQMEKYQTYLEVGTQSGATLETPLYGCAPEGGHFVRPAIFSGVDPDSRLAQEEIFSPILSIMSVPSYDAALEVVNNSAYGLSAGIVTKSVATAMDFARDARTGLVKVNQPTNGMAMNAPFGGMKRSSTQTFKEQAGASMMQFYTHDKTTYFSS